MPDLTVHAGDCGCTTPSTRLPEALIDRWRAGDSITELAEDYRIPEEQVAWGIELAALREVLASLPPFRRDAALRDAENRLNGFRRFEIAKK